MTCLLYTSAFHKIICKDFHLFFQTRRKHCKSHYLDQTNVLFFDIMPLCMWMIYSKRMLFCCNIVAERKIQLICIPNFSCDWSDRVVWLSICVRKYKRRFVCICLLYTSRSFPQKYFKIFYRPDSSANCKRNKYIGGHFPHHIDNSFSLI